LTKLPTERKANLLRIRTVDEMPIIQDAEGFLKERFNAEVSVFSEDDKERYDPKQRAFLAMPNQPAIYVE